MDEYNEGAIVMTDGKWVQQDTVWSVRPLRDFGFHSKNNIKSLTYKWDLI